MSEYERFLESKAQFGANRGFSAPDLPEFLFDFQRALVSWALEYAAQGEANDDADE